jgi:Xaa-Pro aminopeptidase
MRLFGKVRLCALVLVTTCASLAPAPAPARQAAFPAAEFAARRAKLFEKISDGIAIIFAASEHEHPVKFRQSPSFYYLTGIEEPDAILILVGQGRQTLVFARKRSDREVRVDGPGIWQVENREEVHGVTRVYPLEDFLTVLSFLSRGARTLYMEVTAQDSLQLSRGEAERHGMRAMQHPAYGTVPKSRQAVAAVRELLPHLPLQDVGRLIDDLRWVKTPYEIERMRRAGAIGAEGVKEAIRATRPGMYEYELEAAARYVYTKSGARGDAFTPIVASGPNTVILHYSLNNRRMEAGDVVYMDYGADYDYYTSDITRTWPVSGRFTPEQEKMYRCVLEARDAIIAAMKPGVTIARLKDVAEEVYKRHGFHKQFVESGRYTGHYVGISVHDVGPADPAMPLEPGVVYNVEPLLESPDGKTHVRLEDTVLITPGGAENLTAGVPVEVAEIYALMGQR